MQFQWNITLNPLLLIEDKSFCIVWRYLQDFGLHVMVPIPINCLYLQGLQGFIWVRALNALSVCADYSQRACGSGGLSQVKWKATTYKDNEISGHFSIKVHKKSEKPHESAK